MIKLSIQPVAGPEDYQTILTESLTHIQIQAKVLETFFPHTGKTRLMQLISLYDSQRKLFWWNWRVVLAGNKRSSSSKSRKIKADNIQTGIDRFLERWFIHSSNSQITCFTCFTSSLCIIESIETWENYTNAYKNAMLAIENEGQKPINGHSMTRMMAHWVSARPTFLDLIENGYSDNSIKEYKYKVIYLDKYITDPYFYHTRCVDYPIPKTKITARKHDTQWHVELEGASQKIAIFILDENYEVLDVSGKAVEGPVYL